MKLPLLVLVGPTGVGKTAVSIQVAKRVGGEIISGDSMQVYRSMDIGTAKIKPAQMQGVPHHLIDIKNPDELFSVAEFQALVEQRVREICARGRLPILVGGTGLYVRSVLREYTFTAQETDFDLRSSLAAEEERHGPGHLHGKLALVDAVAALRLHANDLRRIIRALEVFATTGVPISQTQTAETAEPRYNELCFGLTADRELLYRRIDQRVEQMLADGWLQEVRGLLTRYSPRLSAMQALGYRELCSYSLGFLTYGETVALIKRNTRRFAKRQYTWFRKDALRWLDVTPPVSVEIVVEEIVKSVEGKWQNGGEPNCT